jgi:hypothetical protein
MSARKSAPTNGIKKLKKAKAKVIDDRKMEQQAQKQLAAHIKIGSIAGKMRRGWG